MARAREWDRSCQVGWQPNAWCDGATFQAIIKMLPCGEGALLFMDNLAAHNLGKEEIKEAGIVPYYGPKNTTDYWQPVDCGVGTTFYALTVVGKWLKGRVYDRILQAEQKRRLDTMDAASTRIFFL